MLYEVITDIAFFIFESPFYTLGSRARYAARMSTRVVFDDLILAYRYAIEQY